MPPGGVLQPSCLASAAASWRITRRFTTGSMGCSGGLGVRVKGLGVSGENKDTSGRIICWLRFIDTAVTARISKTPHIQTPPERCKSKLSLVPPWRQRKLNDFDQALALGNDIDKAIKQSIAHTMARIPMNQIPSSIPKPSGICMLKCNLYRKG